MEEAKQGGKRRNVQSMSLCLVSASEADRRDLEQRFGASYTIRVLAPARMASLSQVHLRQVIAPAAVVLVDWSDQTLAIVPFARQVASPCGVPVFALCGPAPSDHVAALVVGADDTLERPVRPVLLEARLLAYRRLVHRGQTPAGDGAFTARLPSAVVSGEDPTPDVQHNLCCVGALVLDRSARCCFARGAVLQLTPKEYDLLAHLMEHAGACRTRDEIMDHAWGIDFETGTNILDVHMYALRKKLKEHGLEAMVQTVRGVGFRLVPEP